MGTEGDAQGPRWAAQVCSAHTRSLQSGWETQVNLSFPPTAAGVFRKQLGSPFHEVVRERESRSATVTVAAQP